MWVCPGYAQEFVTEADAVVGSLDQTGQVGEDERSLAADEHLAEVGVLGREGIVGDLRRAARQTRLSNVDLPALGSPTRPTSAMTLSSRMSHVPHLGMPGWKSGKARFVEVAKAACCHVRHVRRRRRTTASPPSVRSRRTMAAFRDRRSTCRGAR